MNTEELDYKSQQLKTTLACSNLRFHKKYGEILRTCAAIFTPHIIRYMAFSDRRSQNEAKQDSIIRTSWCRFYDSLEKYGSGAQQSELHLVSKFANQTYSEKTFLIRIKESPIISYLDARTRIAGRFYAPAQKKGHSHSDDEHVRSLNVSIRRLHRLSMKVLRQQVFKGWS